MNDKIVKHSKNHVSGSSSLEECLRNIWAQIVPVLGIIPARVMLEYARDELKEKYPLLEKMRIQNDGVRLNFMIQGVKAGILNKNEVKKTLEEYILTLVKVLERFTGQVISCKIKDLIFK